MILGNKELTMEFKRVLDLALPANSIDPMTRLVPLNALVQESKINQTILILADLLAKPATHGEMKTANASLPVRLHGKLSLKTEFKSVKSHASPANGGQMKIKTAKQLAMPHGFQALLRMVFQLALDHVLLDNSIDLTTTPAALNALHQESRMS